MKTTCFASFHPLTVKLGSLKKSDRLAFVNGLNQNKCASCVEKVSIRKDGSLAIDLDGQPGLSYYETLHSYLSPVDILERDLHNWGTDGANVFQDAVAAIGAWIDSRETAEELSERTRLSLLPDDEKSHEQIARENGAAL